MIEKSTHIRKILFSIRLKIWSNEATFFLDWLVDYVKHDGLLSVDLLPAFLEICDLAIIWHQMEY